MDVCKKIKISSRTIILYKETIERFTKYTQNNNESPESGGILFCQKNSDGFHLIDLTTPSSHDKQSRFSFYRNKKRAQRKIKKKFHKSKGKTIYIGEWHTHPEDNPRASYQDRSMIKDQFLKNELNEDFLIMIISGRVSNTLYIMDDSGLSKGIKFDRIF